MVKPECHIVFDVKCEYPMYVRNDCVLYNHVKYHICCMFGMWPSLYHHKISCTIGRTFPVREIVE